MNPKEFSGNAGRSLSMVVALLAIFVLAGCEQKPQQMLRVGTNTWPGYELLYLANDLGYYEGKNIAIVRYPSSSDSMRALRNGLLEGAALTMDEALLLKSEGRRIKIVMIFDISHGGDAIIAQPGISSMKQLKGKKVGVENTALGAYMLTRGLKESGMELHDISIISKINNEHEEAFLKRAVDAVVTFEPVRTRLLDAGGIVVFDSTSIPGEIIDVLVVREDIVKNNQQIVQEIVNGYMRSFEYMEANRERAIAYMAQMENLGPKEFSKSLNGIRLAGREDNRRMLAQERQNLTDVIGRMEGILLQKNLISATVDIDELLDERFVK